ncbi:hypothetical protein RFN28_29635 [Mesorhizobium sp. VK24D]|uniref:Uncharacterized protein n=1 Tax=Mesorhizobium album TaxID=3072314 RepID=A0ABU4Y9I1_9HYPH|nr:hypothetical protein [Mesorhizobium sp. VK24D]MDX8482589.1 hypothetical protein [Mesorhizobium sp. VK24D]
MAIKFSPKEVPAATVKPAKPAAAPKAVEPVATDLFETPAQVLPRKTGKKK